jgi:integrase
VIYVRRGVVEGLGIEQSTKTENGERIIDIDPELADVLRQHLAGRTSGRVFQSRNGAPIHAGNLRNRMLYPLLDKLGIPRGGFHAFRHARVTILRKHGAPAELQTQWIGHSNLRMTDRYSHTDEQVEYRQRNAGKLVSVLLLDPMDSNLTRKKMYLKGSIRRAYKNRQK